MIYTHPSASLTAAWGRRDSRDTGFAQWGGLFPKKSVYFCISYSAWQLCVFTAHLRYEAHRDVNKVEFKQKRRGKFSDGSTGGKKKKGKVDLPSTKSCNASVPFDVRHKCPLWVVPACERLCLSRVRMRRAGSQHNPVGERKCYPPAPSIPKTFASGPFLPSSDRFKRSCR